MLADTIPMRPDQGDSLPALLHDVARQMRYRFDARVRDLGVTRAQWRALMVLARNEGATQSELAELVEVERITLCRLVDRLTDAGLVERRADPKDRRVWRLHLTDHARTMVGEMRERGMALEEEMLALIEPDERQGLRRALERLRAGLRETGAAGRGAVAA